VSTRLLIVRHGETDWNVAGRLQGQLDLPLNATGRTQAAQAAAALASEPLAAIYASDLARAWDTAAPIAATQGLAARPEPGLRERHFGHWQGATRAEIAGRSAQDAAHLKARTPDFTPSGGESLRTFAQRVQATVEALATRHAGQTLLLVTHGGVLDVLYRLAHGLALDAPRGWDVPNAGLNQLRWRDGRLWVEGWGDVDHLMDEARDELI